MTVATSPVARTGVRAKIADAIEGEAAEVRAVSRRIHTLAEPSFDEHESARLLADVLEQKGFEVTRALCEVSPAFKATAGSGQLTVGIFLEYDALPEVDSLLARVSRCFEAGALATGASLDIAAVGPVYDALTHDETLCEHWSDAMSIFGHDVSRAPGLSGGSTDMGNVSQIIPTIYPWIGIPGATSPVHSHPFAASADTAAAYDVMLQAALGMAWTAASVASSPASDQFRTAAIARRLSSLERKRP